MDAAARHLPRPAPIEAYGNGGFRFGGLSHRGSLMCLPSGIWASAVRSAGEIDAAALAMVFAADAAVDHFLIGTGREAGAVAQMARDRILSDPIFRDLFTARRIALEAMTTGAAVRTWNILLGERRRVGALLVAVE